jgi:hypothetical protein
MHVFLRWYQNGQPLGAPQKMANENAARSALLSRFPSATFGQRTKTLHQPSFNLAGIDEVLYAYPGPQAPGVQPVAEILFPPP